MWPLFVITLSINHGHALISGKSYWQKESRLLNEKTKANWR